MSHKHHRKSGRPVTMDLPMEDPETDAGDTGTEEVSIAAMSMTIGDTLNQLRSIRENAETFLTDPPDPEHDAVWVADMEAVDAASAILSALQGEGIENAEQVKDLLFDYTMANRQLQAMHEKYEKPTAAERTGNLFLCPECRARLSFTGKHCGQCGKRIAGR